jgi:L-lactate dehydrogenase
MSEIVTNLFRITMKAMPADSNKISVIGCGRVGTTAAFAILMEGLANELVLFNRTLEVAEGEKLDLEHGLPFLQHCTITATNDYKDTANSDVVIVTAGAAQQPGETRLDLAQKNTAIIEDTIQKIVQYSPEAIVLIVSNPVDVLTYKAYLKAGLPKGRIFGSGTTLDTARFRFYLSDFMNVNPNSIHAYILGEHGDTSFPALSSASVGGQPLTVFSKFSQQGAMEAYQQARDAAYTIIKSKGSTHYGIGVVITRLVRAILRDEGSIFPVSIPLHQYYGLNGVALSVPCVIGRKGVEEVLEIKLNWEEKQQLEHAAQTVRQYL